MRGGIALAYRLHNRPSSATSGQEQRRRGMANLARSMDAPVDGERIDRQDVARAVDSGRVGAEGQQQPQDEAEQAFTAAGEPDNRLS